MCQAYEGYEPYKVLKRTSCEVYVWYKCANFFTQQFGQDIALSLNMLSRRQVKAKLANMVKAAQLV